MLLGIQEFHWRFRTSDLCLQFLFELRFADARCPKCQRANAYHRHPSKPCFTCNCGRHHIFPAKGTIFQASPLPLTKWFYAAFLVLNSDLTLSATELARRIDVAYPTAWRMMKMLRGVAQRLRAADHQFPFDEFLAACVFEDEN